MIKEGLFQALLIWTKGCKGSLHCYNLWQSQELKQSSLGTFSVSLSLIHLLNKSFIQQIPLSPYSVPGRELRATDTEVSKRHFDS